MNVLTLTVINLLITGISVVVLGLTIKIYTEMVKDKLQDRRKEAK
jgi:hypothetical protein